MEGFWNAGKTTLLKSLEQKDQYIVINEPDHLKSPNVLGNINIDDWYIAEHRKNLERLCSFPPTQRVAMERSILSSMAYLFACGKTENTDVIMKIFEPFKHWYDQSEATVAFLYAEDQNLEIIKKGVKNSNIKRQLNDHSFCRSYDDFYKQVLPRKYGVFPLVINIFTDDNKRKNVAECLNGLKSK
jgi:hypothetical protein